MTGEGIASDPRLYTIDGSATEPAYMAEWRAEVKALRARNNALQAELEAWKKRAIAVETKLRKPAAKGTAKRLQAALDEICNLELEGDASLADAIAIADEALNPPPLGHPKDG
jgi:molecular chaperone GrpE (heat shock protein)